MLNKTTPRIWRYAPVKQLTFPSMTMGGRNNQGRIVTFHRGGRCKFRYRLIDFRRRFYDIPAFVLRLEHDPIRDAPIALIVYANGVLSYILAFKHILTNTVISAGWMTQILPGSATIFKRIPIGQFVHNVEKLPGLGGTFVRTAGNKAQIIKKTKQFAVLQLASGEYRAFPPKSYATIGVIEQSAFFKRVMTKAGNNRWLGKRPIVRGVAQNPIDHPHGGGEGKSSGGRLSCSPWGILTKGYKTRSPRKSLTHIIKTRSL